MTLRLAEAQQLYDGLNDPLISAGLTEFFSEGERTLTGQLVRAVKQSVRDTMREARLAGKVEAYEEMLPELRKFAVEQLKGAANGE